MKKIALLFLFVLLGSLTLVLSTRNVYATTLNYGNVVLGPAFTAGHWNDVWDLTSGDLTLSYTVDMTGVVQPAPWVTPYAEIGIRQLGAGDFNPPPFNTYQGGTGGWMTSLVGDLTPSPGILSDMDKHNLGASGGRGEGDYDCIDANTVVAPFGTTINYGIWFDRDTVDPFQAGYWGSVNGATYNTLGIYNIVIHYHAITPTLGSMFATINGIPTGFYTPAWINGPPNAGAYPAGLSFKGDMTHMQVFAGFWGAGPYGTVQIQSLTVTGNLLMVLLTVNSPYDTPTPTSGSYPWGTSITASVTSPWAGPPGTRYVSTGYKVTMLNGTVISGTGTTVTFTLDQATTIDWLWKTQYYLTVAVDPSGIVPIPSGTGWYDSGTPVTLTAPAGPMSNPFLNWDVDGVSKGNLVNPITVTMNAAHTATAHYYVASVGGEWAPINAVQLLAPYVVLALIAVAALAAGSWRLIKKHW